MLRKLSFALAILLFGGSIGYFISASYHDLSGFRHLDTAQIALRYFVLIYSGLVVSYHLQRKETLKLKGVKNAKRKKTQKA